MDYPASLKLSSLQAQNAAYTKVQGHLKRISLLCKGGWELRDALPMFLKKRPSEIDEVYSMRLEKFAYSNVLGAALSQLAAKFSSSEIGLAGATDEDFWQEFREDNNGLGRDEKNLVECLFSSLMTDGKVFAHVDKPVAAFDPRSKAEEEQLGLRPSIVLYPALQVPAWGKDNGRLKWIKVFQITEDNSDPTKPAVMRATWTFIDDEAIARYGAPVKIKHGKITHILNEKGEEIDHPDADVSIKLLSPVVKHGMGRIPVKEIELPKELWAGNQAYAKAEECLRLECHRLDLITASYFQRTWSPVMEPDADLDNSYADSDEAELPTGLEYVAKVGDFRWSEPTGAIIEPLSTALEAATREIRALLSVGGAYAQEGMNESSGRSKEMDFVNENASLAGYGAIVTGALQDIYQMVGRCQGQTGYEAIAVSGLDTFGHEQLSTLVGKLNQLISLDYQALSNILTPTLYDLLSEKLIGFLLGNLTPAQKEQVLSELEGSQEAQ